jgi:hypothetical protein
MVATMATPPARTCEAGATFVLPLLCGDVAGAYRFAASILMGALPPRDLFAARLVLTAVCLHLSSGNGPEPTLGDLLNSLVDLSKRPAPFPEFLKSGVQFLNYAALEIAALDAASRAEAFRLSLDAVDRINRGFIAAAHDAATLRPGCIEQ